MSMSFNVKDYCKVYHNFFDKEFCNSVVKSLDSIEFEKHKYYTAQGDYVSTDTDLDVSYGPIPQTPQMHEGLWHLLHQYVKQDLNLPWFAGWKGMSIIRFNKYNVNTRMERHCDHIHSLFDGTHKGIPILSIVGALNDNYKGGEFLMWNDEVVELPAGSIMVFPSNFLYPHSVATVTEGVRHSFVSWVW